MIVTTQYAIEQMFDVGTAVPTSLFLQAHTADPTDSGLVAISAELSPQRVAFTRGSVVAGVAENTTAATWGVAAGPETITHVSVWDAVSGGNCWFYGVMVSPFFVDTSNGLNFPISYIKMGAVL